MKALFLSALFGISIMAHPALAQDSRGFVADRPGATDSPITMMPGQYRLESGLASFSFDEVGNTKTNEFSFLGFNLVTGVNLDSELQVSFVPFIERTTKSNGSSSSESYSGDLGIKYKRNIVGNEGGPVALAFTPQLQFTSEENGRDLIGGVGIPVSVKLPMEISLAITPQWNFNFTESDSGYNSQYLGMVLGRNFTDALNFFVEYYSTASVNEGFQTAGGVGFSHQSSSNFQWDLSADVGLTEGSTDTLISTGFVYAWL